MQHDQEQLRLGSAVMRSSMGRTRLLKSGYRPVAYIYALILSGHTKGMLPYHLSVMTRPTHITRYNRFWGGPLYLAHATLLAKAYLGRLWLFGCSVAMGRSRALVLVNYKPG